MILLPNENELREFQDDAITYLIDETAYLNERKTITLKSPTGSGKTVILIGYIDRYQEFGPNDNVTFVWLTPGMGDLEEQSKKKMERFTPHLKTQSIEDVLTDGFAPGATTFINWEQVTKTSNVVIADNERKNLFDQIANSHRVGTRFILIIDEEHSHNTSKANNIIRAFSADVTIRVSATATRNPRFQWYEIPEEDVIEAELIKKALYINEGLTFTDEELSQGLEGATETEVLLQLADAKRKEILEAYKELGKDVRPLVLIQFPSSSSELIQQVENQLAEIGYTYDNKMVAKWMADEGDKINLEGIEKNDALPAFLLIKQAVATGWDSPRSHVLVKLRENMDENFEIQTLGRIRRMPEAKHYDIECLDCCYLYTFDEKYKESIIRGIESSYEVTKLKLKESVKTFQLPKENRDMDFDMIGMADVYNLVYDFFIKFYSLTEDFDENKKKLERGGYQMDGNLLGSYRKGRYVTYKDLAQRDNFQKISYTVDTNKHSIDMMHSIDIVKKTIKISHENVKAILLSLFSKQVKKNKKLLSLKKLEWYAFIINNAKKIRDDFRIMLASTDATYQSRLVEVNPKVSTFHIPEEDYFKFDSSEQHVDTYISNAYENYTTQMTIAGLRSSSEQLFEIYCESSDAIKWVYKNGDTGQQYLSIVYLDQTNNQWLFYPDYIIMLKNGDVWVIETKGGETSGRSNNIDIRSEIKFRSFKEYGTKNNINWGFVRDKNHSLFLNNTNYTEEMNNDEWKPLKQFF